MQLAFRNVWKRFGATIALQGASASPTGTMNLILGPNGCGKTTLVNCILGMKQPHDGTLEVNGREYSATSGSSWRLGARLVRERSCYLGAKLGVPTSFTGREYLDWAFRAANREPNETLTRAVETLMLSPFLNQRIGGYSSGMKQKVALAASLAASPELVFWDEPISNMDAQGREQVLELVKFMSARGCRFIVVSHIPAELEPLVDWVGFMSAGKFVASGEVGGFAMDSDVFVAETKGPRELAERLVKEQVASEVRVQVNAVMFKIGAGLTEPTSEGLARTTGCEVSGLRRLPPSIRELYARFTGGKPE